MKHRIPSIAISCLLLLSMLPFSVYADTEAEQQSVAVQSAGSVEQENGPSGETGPVTEESDGEKAVSEDLSAVSQEEAPAEEQEETLEAPQKDVAEEPVEEDTAEETMEEDAAGEPMEEDAAEPTEVKKPESPEAADGSSEEPTASSEQPVAEPMEETPDEPVELIDIGQAEVSGVDSKTYTGQPVTQDEEAITVTLGETTLTAGEDYEISYLKNDNAGTAYVVITGIGDYTGEVRTAFTISARSISEATVTGISRKSYTGKAVTQTPVVMMGDITLECGTDYRLSYKNNKAVGIATVTITGKGNYKDAVTRTFRISDKQSLTAKVNGYKCKFKTRVYVNYRLPAAACPVNLYLTARKSGIVLKWSDCRKSGASIDGYLILRRIRGSSTYKVIRRVSAKTLTYTDKAAKKKNKLYYYVVVGYQKNSNGSFTVSPARSVRGVVYGSKRKNSYSAKLNMTRMTLYKGYHKTLTLTYKKPDKVCSTWAQWRSSDPSVATVDKNGRVTGVAPGKATIYVRTASGRRRSCEVTVYLTPSGRVVKLAKKEIGYKATGKGTYGSRFSKYAKELDAMGDVYNTPKNGYDWCDIFADWCYIKALGKARALKAINQPRYGCGAGCYYSAGYYREMGRFSKTPSIGAQIFYDWDGDRREDHTGIVVGYDSKYVYTVEGNTGGGTGQVAERQRLRTYKCITGYGKPKW